MAGLNVDVSTGITVVFATSGFTGEIIDAGLGGVSRKSIDVSHMGTAAPGATAFGNMPFIPGRLSDAGELTLELHFNPQTIPPLDLATETVTVTFPLAPGDATPATYVFQGFFTEFSQAYPLDDKMVVSATVKVDGEIAVTVAA